MKSFLQFLIRAYQAAGFLWKTRCRFLPTCSHYALEALERHGAARGLALTLGRLARCHPLGGRGVDLVPPLPQ